MNGIIVPSEALALHEALELGPMWARQSAYWLALDDAQAATPAPNRAVPTQRPAFRQPEKTPPPVESTVSSAPQPMPRRTHFDRPEALDEAILTCQACSLAHGRKQALLGKGVLPARLLVLSEAPVFEDDLAAELLSGDAGRLLMRMFSSIDVSPDDIYVTSAVKCAPPAGVAPTPEALQQCQQFLQTQITLAAPQAIVALGRFRLPENMISPVFQLPHPAKMLSRPALKSQAWEELKRLRAHLRDPS